MTVDELTAEARKLLAQAGATDLTDRIDIRYNRRMRTRAGACTYRRIRRDHVPSRFVVELNPRLLLDRHPEGLVPTLAHELAHAVVRARHGGSARAHGPEWRATMQRMGHDDRRCHDFDVAGLARPSRGESRWICRACAKTVTLGPIQTRRERRRRGSYTCLCGGGLLPYPEPWPEPCPEPPARG